MPTTLTADDLLAITAAVYGASLPGIYTAGQAGYIIGNLEANVAAAVLAQPGILATAGNVSGTLNIRRDVTYSETLTSITFPATWLHCLLSIKRSMDDEDSQSIVQLRVTNGGDAGDGLLYLEGQPYTTKTDGALTANSGANTLAIMLKDEATAQLSRHANLVYGVKFLLSTGASSEPYTGACTIGLAVNRALT